MSFVSPVFFIISSFYFTVTSTCLVAPLLLAVQVITVEPLDFALIVTLAVSDDTNSAMALLVRVHLQPDDVAKPVTYISKLSPTATV